jgi:acyl-CoA synthetase (AMP-forming)/AMP-acid ligase II
MHMNTLHRAETLNIAQAIERGSLAFPAKPALVFAGESISYRGLEEMSSRVANGLARHGIACGDRVALLLPNGIAFVAAYFGILKLGAVVVAINPAFKSEEIGFILNDSGAKAAIAAAALLGHLSGLAGIETVFVADGGQPGIASLDDLMAQSAPSAPAADMGADALAAILYTSGTTGAPKGAALTHGNMMGNIHACVEAFQLRPEDRVLLCLPLFHSFGQTAALNPTLEAGATLILHSQVDADAVGDALGAEQITVFFGIPSLYLLLQDKAGLPAWPALRLCISAAAALPAETARRWEDTFGLPIHQGYGLTETCLNSFNANPSRKPGSVGTPLAGVELAIMDANGMRIEQAGELGEIAVRGTHVMPGYWGMAAAETLREGWFHTGDVGYCDADGYLYIADRIKDMINVGGTKVYPSEVEKVLRRHPAVLEAAVYGIPDRWLEERVCASLVLQPGQQLAPEAAMLFCRQRLAEFKAPTWVEVVDTLPKGRTGKVLKRELREQAQRLLESARAAPLAAGAPLSATPVEAAILSIWQAVLQQQQVGLQDDFFALGGNSLLATQAANRMRGHFQLDFNVRGIFEHPTVARQAEFIGQRHRALALPPLKRAPRNGPLSASLAQAKLWMLDQRGQAMAFNVPLHARLHGQISVAALQHALDELLKRHESLRTAFIETQGELYQLVQAPRAVPLRVLDLKSLPAAEQSAAVEHWQEVEARQPFDLANGQVLSVRLLLLDDSEALLLLTLHHIATDGWSQNILARELAAFYAAFALQQPARLPELPVQYADFAIWQRQWLQAETLSRQLGYWKARLAGAPNLPALPTDHPRPKIPRFRGANVPFELGAAPISALRQLTRQAGCTLFMTLLAAWQILLGRYSGRDDLVVGTPIANRAHQDIEGLIGFFVNTLALRADLSGNPSFLAFLAQARQTTLEAYEHQDLPFEYLAKELSPDHGLSGLPLIQTNLNLQAAALGEISLPGMTLGKFQFGGQVIPFDLELMLWETDHGGLEGIWNYDRDLFEPSTIERMAEHYRSLLDAIVDSPQQGIADLALRSEAEWAMFGISPAAPIASSPAASYC